MSTEQQLIDLSQDLDQILALLCITYQISPLSLAAVVNARLMHACIESEAENDFRKLLLHISELDVESSTANLSMH
jgi:hypothetical protein